MSECHRITGVDETQLRHLAEVMAASARPGDLIGLEGDLGAGKTTFARAFIRALTGNRDEEIPSPTFTLVQTYDAPRMPVAHVDLYRLADADEIDELGLDAALNLGVVLVEWPERGAGTLPAGRITLRISESASSQTEEHRDILIVGTGLFAPRVSRLIHMLALIQRAGFGAGSVTYLQGDASPRRYARLALREDTTALLMDWPRQPDGPPIRDGLPYSRIAHLAEDVRPFVAIADALRHEGVATPSVLAADLDTGLLVIEDFGDRVFGRELASGADQVTLWEAALDILVHLRSVPAGKELAVAGDGHWTLPRYDARAMAIETELLADWLWPFATGAAMPARLREDFIGQWRGVIEDLQRLATGWTLRDFHSPNLIWRPEATGLARVGVIDFQDAMQGPLAYDVVSLTQDARLDVAADIERHLLDRYCSLAAAREPRFDEAQFRFAYAALGLQRNTKILGIFARLAIRDGKTSYIAHMPRIWGYIDRCLEHPRLGVIRTFYDAQIRQLARS